MLLRKVGISCTDCIALCNPPSDSHKNPKISHFIADTFLCVSFTSNFSTIHLAIIQGKFLRHRQINRYDFSITGLMYISLGRGIMFVKHDILLRV
jgi:hypothetical protein